MLVFFILGAIWLIYSITSQQYWNPDIKTNIGIFTPLKLKGIIGAKSCQRVLTQTIYIYDNII